MATKIFTGNAAATVDTWTVQVTVYADTTVLGVVRNGKTVGFTIVGSGYTAATAAAALQVLLAASTYGEFLEYTWTNTAGSDTVTGTAKTAGVPATFTRQNTNVTITNTVPATGPNSLDNAANWSTGTVVANGDNPVFNRFSPSALYGLTAWSALTGLTIDLIDFGNSIGLPPVRGNANSFDPTAGGGYVEDRTRYLLLSASTPTINVGRGATLPARVQIQFGGAANATVNVFGSQPPQNGEPAAVYLYGTTGHTALNVTQGWVGVAAEVGQAGGFAAVRVGSEDSPADDAHVVFGAGATVPSVENQSGGTESAATITALTLRDRAVKHRQTGGNLTAATAQGGVVTVETGATMVVTFSGTAKLDLSRDPRPKTISTGSTFTDAASLYDPAGTATALDATFTGDSLAKSDLGPSTRIVRP